MLEYSTFSADHFAFLHSVGSLLNSFFYLDAAITKSRSSGGGGGRLIKKIDPTLYLLLQESVAFNYIFIISFLRKENESLLDVLYEHTIILYIILLLYVPF